MHWDGTRDLSGPELCQLTQRTRWTLHEDVKRNLLPKPERRAGVKARFFPAVAVRRYLKHKFPHLLPGRNNPTPTP